LYTPGLSKYHSYGAEPASRLQSAAFTALIWKSATSVGIGCTAFHTFDAATKVKLIDTKVNVVVTLGGSGRGVSVVNANGSFKSNVLPPNDIAWTDYTVNIQT